MAFSVSERHLTGHILPLDAYWHKVKKQELLPAKTGLLKGGGLERDSIVFLDRVNNLPIDTLPHNEISEQRLFTLSDYGFYLFLFKLSIHFTRIRDAVSRPPYQEP